MNTFVLANARLVTRDKTVAADVTVRDGRVEKISAAGRNRPAKPPLPGSRVIDCRGMFAAPGFVDLHINGVLPAVDAGTGDEAFYRDMARLLPRYGVTAFLPTVYTCRFARMCDKLDAIAAVMKSPQPGHARVLGAHLEGPFLSPERKGSHPPEEVIAPSTRKARELWDASDGTIRIMTFAPEVRGADKLLAFCLRRGIIAAIGHTDGNFETVSRAAKGGMRYATHLFNAMSPFASRAPGAVGAVLADEDVTAEIIADGVHVHPAAIQLAARLKGPDKIILVSDGISAARAGNGACAFEGREVNIEKNVLRLGNGTLTGSSAMMDRGLKVLVEKCGFTLENAVAAASFNPAAAMGLAGEGLGQISRGLPAYITVFDEVFRIRLTITPDGVAYEHKSMKTGKNA